jgi:drug/metabolite transporter (DMT)-like permease
MKETKINDTLFGINREYIAVILMAMGSMLTTTAYVYANERKYHPFTTVTIRGVVAVIVIYLISLRQKKDLTFANVSNFKWYIANGLTLLIGALIYAWSQFYLSQPVVIAINSTSPIYCAIFDKFLYNVSLNRAQICWLVVTFIGVLLAANGEQILAFFSGST